jgi:hypothetical protein
LYLVGLAGARLTDLRAGQDSKNSKQGRVLLVPASRTARQTTAGHAARRSQPAFDSAVCEAIELTRQFVPLGELGTTFVDDGG